MTTQPPSTIDSTFGAADSGKSGAAGASGGRFTSFLPWFLLLVLLLLVASWRVRMIPAPLERDEGEYAYAGQLILQGIPPYVQMYNMKMPGIYACYALVLAIFGQTHIGIHTALLFLNLTAIVLVFLLGRRLLGVWEALAAAMVFATLSSTPEVQGIMANAEHFVLLPMLAGLLVLLIAQESGRRWLLGVAGLLLGTAVMIKQHGAFFLAWGGIYLVVENLTKNPRQWRKTLADAAIYSLGGIAPFLLTCALFAYLGVFGKFWFWTVTYARTYASESSWDQGLAYFRLWTPFRYDSPTASLWLIGLTGAVACVADERVRSRAFFLFGFLLFGMLSICPGFYFRPHYFVMMLPATALMAGAGAGGFGRLLAAPRTARFWLPVAGLVGVAGYTAWMVIKAGTSMEHHFSLPHHFVLRILLFGALAVVSGFLLGVLVGRLPAPPGAIVWGPVVLALVAVVYTVWAGQVYYFQWTPTRFVQWEYWPDPFPEALVIGNWIREHSAPTDPIVIIGSEPEICFYAQRHSSTGFIYMYPLMENQPNARKMQQQMIKEIEANPPKYLVFANEPNSWDKRHTSAVDILEWFVVAREKNYELVGLVDMVSPVKTNYYWDAEAERMPVAKLSCVRIYKRRD